MITWAEQVQAEKKETQTNKIYHSISCYLVSFLLLLIFCVKLYYLHLLFFLNRLQGRSEIKVRVQSLMFNYKFTVDLTSKWYQNLLGKTRYLSDM